MRLALAIAAALLLTAADRPAGGTLADIVRGRVAEKPVDCIDPQQVRNTRVVPGVGIVYDTVGRLYVNTLLSGAARLRWDDVLVQRIEGGQLCRIDAITLLDPVTRGTRGFVVLGSFTPYRAGQVKSSPVPPAGLPGRGGRD